MFANFTRKQSLMNTNYTNEEICALYREAANKKTQIGILAELTLKTKGQIKEILRENGFDVERLRGKGRARPARAWYDDKAQALYKAGKTPQEMAYILGVERRKIYYWHHNRGYIVNRPAGCVNCIHSFPVRDKMECPFEGNVLKQHICERYEKI